MAYIAIYVVAFYNTHILYTESVYLNQTHVISFVWEVGVYVCLFVCVCVRVGQCFNKLPTSQYCDRYHKHFSHVNNITYAMHCRILQHVAAWIDRKVNTYTSRNITC